MQLHLPTHSETRGLYTNTEYDDIRLGPPRVVYSYCPRTHRYVRDVAHAILAAQGVPADDPDAQLEPDTSLHGNIAYAIERRAHREALVVEAINAAGKPIKFSEAMEAAGCGDQALRGMLQQSDVLQHLGRRANDAYIGLMHHTRADLPLTPVAQRMVAVMREIGEGTQREICAGMGWARGGDWGKYQWLLDHRTELFHNGRQVYTQRIYRLKPEYAK